MIAGCFERVSGLISVPFGIAVAYQVGVVDGLFMRTPHWTPR